MMPIDTRQFVHALQSQLERARRAVQRRLDQFGEHVIGDAQELAPVDTGALKASATTEPAEEVSDGVFEKSIGFGVAYAAAVHERVELHHDQGQAKFLESAMENNKDKMVEFVTQDL